MIYVIKKNGTLQNWDDNKIISAIRKSAERTTPLTDEQEAEIVALVNNAVFMRSDNTIPVEQLHNIVIAALKEVREDVASSYIDYRNLRKMWSNMMEGINKKVSSLLFIGDKSNANADSSLSSTIGCLMADYLSEELWKKQFLTKPQAQAIEDGYIKVHDMVKRLYMTHNCDLFDVAGLLKGGFESANTWYNEPKTIEKAMIVVGDIVTMAASQQYGGFTLPEVDKILSPYAEKSYNKYFNEFVEDYMALGIDEETAKAAADKKAEKKVTEDIYQGAQGWEYKFNTVASSRGDYPFVTITFGLQTDRWGRIISKAFLETRMNGQGASGKKKPVLFPKLVFLYDEKLHGKGGELEDVFEAGVKCSSKTMYPDWLSMSGEGYISSMYKKYGKVISPMGCRAFLSPYWEKGGLKPLDETDTPIFEGRFNIGVVSLNLPMIYQKSVMEGKDFYEVLDFYLEMIRAIHKKTYDYIGEMPASRNPLAFCEGGLYGGNLGYDQKIKENPKILEAATASFGITALNELEQLARGKSITEDGSFSLEVMRYINAKLEEFKEEDHHLYAVYGTPAESLCGLQVKQFRSQYGIIKNVSDREYVTNSFHCHVTEDISPIEKQDLEGRFWELFNGGKIQYVRYHLGYNLESMRTLIRRAMALGFYEGVNLALSFCDDCGHQAVDLGDECPCCGSKNLTKVDRMNGYLSYSRVKGQTRLNDAKMAEIAERKSM